MYEQYRSALTENNRHRQGHTKEIRISKGLEKKKGTYTKISMRSTTSVIGREIACSSSSVGRLSFDVLVYTLVDRSLKDSRINHPPSNRLYIYLSTAIDVGRSMDDDDDERKRIFPR